MASSPANRWQLLKLKQRVFAQLRELEDIRAELRELNTNQFTQPVAADDQPWILGVEPTRRELLESLSEIEARLAEF